MEVEIESMQWVDVGFVVAVLEEVEVVGGEAEVTREEEEVMGASTVMVSLELAGGDVVLVTAKTELGEVTAVESSLTSVTELMVADISDVLMEGKEAASPAAAGAPSTDRIPFDSGRVDLVDRFVAVTETELSLPGAAVVSKVVMEVVVIVELEVTEMLGMMESEEVGVTETVMGGSVGVVVLGRVVGGVWGGGSVEALASGIEGLLSSSVTFVGVVAAAVGSTVSVHISVTEGGTVLEDEIITSVESATELEIVGTGAVAVAVRAGGAAVGGGAVGLNFVGVLVSPSCIWASSFSGVLRPDVVGGGPGLRTGFGSKAGFPADSCADTLGRI